jgi:hypothetical protein
VIKGQDTKPLYVVGKNFATTPAKQARGSRTINAELNGLQPGVTYYYRAVLDYSYGHLTGQVKTFTTSYSSSQVQSSNSGSGASSSSNNSSSTGTTSNQGSTTIVGNYTSLVPGSGSSSKAKTTSTSTTTKKVGTGASVFGFSFPSLNRSGNGDPVIAGIKDGVKLTITDNKDHVDRGEKTSYEVTVENTTSRDIKHVTIQVSVPKGFTPTSMTGYSEYDKAAGIVTIELGSIEAKDSETQNVDMKIGTGANSNSTVYAQATFNDRGTDKEVEAKDTNTVGTGSVLGASVFGSGFFPQTFAGWFIIAFFIWLIFMLARYYKKQSAQLPTAPAKA